MKSVPRRISCCLCFLLLAIAFSSCSKKAIEIPKDILGKEEIIPVLVDVHLAQAAAGISQVNDSLHLTPEDYSLSVFKLHHITREKYTSSLEFYTAHPELLDEIYAEVINELSKKQSEAERK
jgi:hypothetical protein